MLNKKSATSISTLILVSMALVLSIVALTAFLTSSKVEKKISDAKFIENVYAKESQLNFFIRQIGENSVENEFNEAKFKEKMKEQVVNLSFEDIDYRNLIDRVNSGNYDVKNENSKTEIEFKDFSIVMQKKITETKYKRIIWIIPVAKIEDIKELLGIVYKTNLRVELD